MDRIRERFRYLLTLLAACIVHKDPNAIAKVYIDIKIFINEPNQHGQTALHLAAMAGDTDLIHGLLNYGAKIDRLDKYNANIFHYGVVHGLNFFKEILCRFPPSRWKSWFSQANVDKKDVPSMVRDKLDKKLMCFMVHHGYPLYEGQVCRLSPKAAKEIDDYRVPDKVPLSSYSHRLYHCVQDSVQLRPKHPIAKPT